MLHNDRLTYLQKLALDGEIAFVITTSNHDDEVLYRMYGILVSIPKEFYNYALESFEEQSNLPESMIARIRAEIASDTVPLWLWENKCISDLKECLKVNSQTSSSISADQKALKMKLIESAFVLFCRKLTFINSKPVIELCNRILEETELSYLWKACSYVVNNLAELPKAKKVTKKMAEQIFKADFDIRDTLAFKFEMETLKQVDKIVEEKEEFDKEIRELADNDDIIQALIEAATKESESTEGNLFVVKKIFKGSCKAIVLETFQTKTEAETFIRDILSNMPELSQTCTFVIEHQIK